MDMMNIYYKGFSFSVLWKIFIYLRKWIVNPRIKFHIFRKTVERNAQ